MRISRYFMRALVGLVAVLALIQLVPYGRDHTNPPSRVEPAWDRPETRALAVRACYDCHSNETSWPWYSHVAPMSWLVQNHVDEGREELNFSEWNRPQREAHEAAELARDKEMPLRSYLLLHGNARLSDAELQELVRGLEATLGTESEHGEHGENEHEEGEEH